MSQRVLTATFARPLPLHIYGSPSQRFTNITIHQVHLCAEVDDDLKVMKVYDRSFHQHGLAAPVSRISMSAVDAYELEGDMVAPPKPAPAAARK